LATTLRSSRTLRLVLLTCVAALAAALAMAALAPDRASTQTQCPPDTTTYLDQCFVDPTLTPEACTYPPDEIVQDPNTGEAFCGLYVYWPSQEPVECPEGYAGVFGTQAGNVFCARLAPPPPPVPTAKEQCKEDGFEEFAHLGFENRGECVAFVERAPRGGGEVVPS
jgi:hypothetical protein